VKHVEKTILVVDDDPDIVKLITKSLRLEQFEVIAAHSGPEALAVLKEKIRWILLSWTL